MKLLVIISTLLFALSTSAQSLRPLTSLESVKNTRKSATITIIMKLKGKFYNEGTAFYIGDEGHIATAAHLFDDRAKEGFEAKLFDHRRNEIDYKVIKCGDSRNIDLCILKTELKPESYFPIPTHEAREGHRLIGVGMCELHSYTVFETDLIRRTKNHHREFNINNFENKANTVNQKVNVVLHSGPQCKGSSGGPLFDERGELQGLFSVFWRKDKDIHYAAVAADEIIEYLKSEIE